MSEVTLGGNVYRLGKLPAMHQLHIARRLAPLMGQATTLVRTFADVVPRPAPGAAAPEAGAVFRSLMQMDTAHVESVLAAFGNALATLPDKDVEYVVSTSLQRVERKLVGDTGWAKVITSTGVMAYDDIDMVAMVRLAGQVVWENLQGFMPAGDPPGNPGDLTTSSNTSR